MTYSQKSVYALAGVAPQVSRDCWIAPGACVIGDVKLGVAVGVWFGAVIRADNAPISVGAGSNIQDGAILHADPGFPLVIGDGVTVGHKALLHGCQIGHGTLIGMGATVMNGAQIGEHSLVAANALVTEGKRFPPRSLIVGSPARVVRELDAPAIAALASSARQYQEKAALFAAQLTAVAGY
jgi:carbonic anhydrase/acetyltransferase-like protein (isoleucine patch superfamily)